MKHNNAKISLILTTLLSCSLPAISQDYEVKSFEQVVTDLTARSGETSRTAFDGHKCAVLKVQSTDRVVEAQGNVFGPLVQKGMETWVYLTDGTKNVKLMFENHFPLEIIFDDYNYPKLTEQMVYVVRLEDAAAPKNNLQGQINTTTLSEGPSEEEIYQEARAAYEEGYYDKAFTLFNRISENALAQFYIALMYDNGPGVSQDYSEAVRWYRKSAEQGNADAQLELGVKYEYGPGVSQDYSEAVRWTRKSAEQGHALAQFNLGYMYENGNGVSQDYSEALRWYRKSAEQGQAQAQNNLGYMYQKGRGVSQEYSEAVHWYRKSAEQGYARAQFYLGCMYEKGRGVSKDYSEAVRWYRRSAQQGDESARVALKRLGESW